MADPVEKNEPVAVGWAYNDERWDATHWHLCSLDSKPRSFEGRKVQAVYLASTVEALKAENAALLSRVEMWRKNSRETFDAMCAMRNAINEHIPMPSLESDLLQGPETSVFCAVVAQSVVAALQEKKP